MALTVAIVGGGPSGFYAASRLLSLSTAVSRIDIYDRLWAPHGLVRYGVAPDHPEVKNCTHKFDQVASDPRLRFFGNVNIATPVPPSIPDALPLPLSSLTSHYTHLLFASGCGVPTLHPLLPPSTHCMPALSFVHWYTAHPSAPPAPPLDKIERVAVIGHGNVAMDVARMLLMSPADLAAYDVPAHVLAVLARSRVRHVSLIGRRGPFEAAFTTKELRELMHLRDAHMVPLAPTPLAPPPGTPLTRQQSRIAQLLRDGSRNPPGSTLKSWSLDFFRAPTGLAPPSADGPARLSLAHTALDPTTNRAVSTGATSVLATDLVVTALGQRAEPTHPYFDPALGHLRSVGGRVVDSTGTTLRRVYASGWAATGARGVLASTMRDAYAAADTLLADAAAPDIVAAGKDVMRPNPYHEGLPPEVDAAVRAGQVTTYRDWKRVDDEEVRRGRQVDKERERMDWAAAKAFLRGA